LKSKERVFRVEVFVNEVVKAFGCFGISSWACSERGRTQIVQQGTVRNL
jgi:hypothetical protein